MSNFDVSSNSIADSPAPVRIDKVNHSSVCITDVYSGNYVSRMYQITIMDNTGFKFSFLNEMQSLGRACVSIPSAALAIMSDKCGPQTISVASESARVSSDPVTTTFDTDQGMWI